MDSYNKIWMIIRETDLLNHDEKDELHLYLMNLKDQVKKQKEVIDKINKYLHMRAIKQCSNGTLYRGLDGLQTQVLENILKEVEND